MCPVIRISDELYERLGKHALGFDSPPKVIERILDHYEGVVRTNRHNAHESSSKPKARMREERLYSNKEIQQRVSEVASGLPLDLLDSLCEESASRRLFGISFPLFVRLPATSNQATKRAAVKTPDEVNRWTWKYEFERDGQVYAICTQWYPRNDLLVKDWLEQHGDTSA